MMHIFIFNNASRAANYGIGTYVRLLSDGLLGRSRRKAPPEREIDGGTGVQKGGAKGEEKAKPRRSGKQMEVPACKKAKPKGRRKQKPRRSGKQSEPPACKKAKSKERRKQKPRRSRRRAKLFNRKR